MDVGGIYSNRERMPENNSDYEQTNLTYYLGLSPVAVCPIGIGPAICKHR